MPDPEEAAPAETLAEEMGDAPPAAEPQENVEVEKGGSGATAESSVAAGAGETLTAEGGEEGQPLQEPAGGSPAGGVGGGGSSEGGEAEGSAEPEEKLALADELFEKGSKAIEDGDFVEAVDCLSRALEIRVVHYGELAPECASSYYKYGCALLYKAQEEADPLGNVPKGSSRRNSESSTTAVCGESSGSSKSPVGDNKPDPSLGNNEEDGEEEGSSKKDQEDDDEGSDNDEDLGEADEDDSDLDLAWKMLDIARAIVEKHPEDSMQKVNILAALGEVAVEREDIETSLGDYHKALSMLEKLVEPSHRRIIELNFRICLVLELGSRIEEALSYCKKATTLCESRLQKLKEAAENSDSTGEHTSCPLSISEKDQEIEVIDGILSELEKKLEDLQQLTLNPKSLFAEIMKTVSPMPSKSEKTASLSSSQLGTMNGPPIDEKIAALSSSVVGVMDGASSDSPTVSTAATGGGSVTHLGVVGRGIKRASLAPISAGPSPKQPLLDGHASDDTTSVSVVTDPKTEES